MEQRFLVEMSGYSMHPFLRPGDRLLVRRVEPGSLRRGDVVVLANGPGSLVAHRLLRVLPDGRGITKGDALLRPDPAPVDLRAAAGRVEAVIRRGRIIPVAAGTRGRLKSLFAALSSLGLTPGALRLRAKLLVQSIIPAREPRERDPESAFILAVLGGRLDGAEGSLDWSRMVEIARSEQVAGLLYCLLEDQGVPGPVMEELARFHHSAAAGNMALLGALEELDRELAIEGLDVMALKGASLMGTAYPRLGMRPMGDLDLVVRPKERELFETLLARLGYLPDPVHPHMFTKARVVVDLHTHALDTERIGARGPLLPSGMGPVWDAALPLGPEFFRIKRPRDADNVLLLAQHLLKHSFSRLFWLVDVMRLLRGRDGPFWGELAERARVLGQERPLAYTLYLLEGLFGFRAPPSSGLGLPSRGLSGFERRLLDIKVRGEEFGLLGNVLLFFCLPGWRARLAFGLETMFPKKPVMARDLGGVRGPHGLVFIRRLANVAVLLAGSGLILLRGLTGKR